MNSIEKATGEFVEAIMNTEQYVKYQDQKQNMKQWPELKERLDEFRIKNFEIQTSTEQSDLYEAMERLRNEYEPLIEDCRVQRFLDAELALCRLVQKINKDIVGSIDFE